jgi:hypothetical protein
MNPYLEHPVVWHDFHQALMPRMRDAINAQVGPNYLVKIEEHIYVQEFGADEPAAFLGRADVAVSERFSSPPTASAAILEAPAQATPLPVDKFRESYLEILDRESPALITVVELLSPSNKTGRDRQQYLAKRDQILESPAHLVEIDLLRGGQRMPFQGLPQCDYYVMVSRAEQRPAPAGIWPLHLREPLPVIPIPLKAGDADVRLNLQQLLHEIHDAAGYAKYIYSHPLSPPLAAQDASWTDELLANLRSE